MCDYLKYPEKIQELCRLINTQGTGKLEQLARKLQISERTTSRLIEYIVNMGYPILFNRQIESYVWADEGCTITCTFKIEKKSLDKTEMNLIRGGEFTYIPSEEQIKELNFSPFFPSSPNLAMKNGNFVTSNKNYKFKVGHNEICPECRSG